MCFFVWLGIMAFLPSVAMDHAAARDCAKNAAYLAVLLERKPSYAQDLLVRAESVNQSRILPCYQQRCDGLLAPWCAYQYYTTKQRVLGLSDDTVIALGGGAVNWAMKQCEKVDE